MRRAAFPIFAVLILAACTTTAQPSSPSSTGLASPSPSTQPSATEVAKATSAPTPGCMSSTPITVDAFLAADPACLATAGDIQVEGFEAYPNGPINPIDAVDPDSVQPAWLGGGASSAMLLPHATPLICPGSCPTGLVVHIDPASGLAFEHTGQWVVVTGHLNDPAAASCTYAPLGGPSATPTPAPSDVQSVCRQAFVATSIEPADPPATELASCPADPILTVAEFQATPPACFFGKNIEIKGFANLAPGIDFGMGPGITPSWLTRPASPITALWSARPVQKDGQPQCPDATDGDSGTCLFMLVYVSPTSKVSFGPTEQWLIVTGHIDDPAAATCAWYVAVGFGTVLPDSQARRQCRDSFVATATKVTTAP